MTLQGDEGLIKEVIEKIVRRYEVLVKFIKQSGETRLLRGTSKVDGVAAEQPVGVVRIFDMDINEWRSFKPDSVKSINIIRKIEATK